MKADVVVHIELTVAQLRDLCSGLGDAAVGTRLNAMEQHKENQLTVEHHLLEYAIRLEAILRVMEAVLEGVKRDCHHRRLEDED